MKSIIINDPFEVEVIDEDIPQAGPGELRVRGGSHGVHELVVSSLEIRQRRPPSPCSQGIRDDIRDVSIDLAAVRR